MRSYTTLIFSLVTWGDTTHAQHLRGHETETVTETGSEREQKTKTPPVGIIVTGRALQTGETGGTMTIQTERGGRGEGRGVGRLSEIENAGVGAEVVRTTGRSACIHAMMRISANYHIIGERERSLRNARLGKQRRRG